MPLLREMIVDNNIIGAIGRLIGTGGLATPPLDEPSLLASRLGITDWLGDIEIGNEKNDPFREKAHKAAKLLSSIVQRLEELKNPSLTSDAALLKRVAGATRSLHVFRSHDVIPANVIHDFAHRWENLMQASFEVLIENFYFSPQTAAVLLQTNKFRLEKLSECSYSDIAFAWKAKQAVGNASGEAAKSGIQTLFNCTDESTPYSRSMLKKYDDYLADVDALSESSLHSDAPDFVSTIHNSIQRLEKFWSLRPPGYAASGTFGTIYLSRNEVRNAYAGDFIIAHEIGHNVEVHRGSWEPISKSNIQKLDDKKDCLLSRNYDQLGTRDERYPSGHFAEDWPDHFAALVIRKLHPQKNSPAACTFLNPLKLNEDYPDEVDLSRASPSLGGSHSRGEVRVLFEALDNGYLPSSCQKVIDGDRLNRSCR